MAKRIFLTTLTVLFFLGISHQRVQAQTNIYKLHSLFIYNFIKHIQWNDYGDAFTVGVFGSQSALNEIKKNLSGKKISGKDIRVINVVGIGDANASQVVYFPKSNKNKILNMYESADKQNTLFVSEDDLTQFGIQISFYIEKSKLGFKVSKKNIEASGLKVSSSLLSLAKVID